MISQLNLLITIRMFLLFVFAFISFPSYSESELERQEENIANEIYDLSALLDSDALDTGIYAESRKKLILFVSRYQREGGDDYRFILPSETIIQDADLRVQISKVRTDAYRACIIEYASLRDVVDVGTFCKTTIAKAMTPLSRDIGEVFEGIQLILTANNKLNEEQAHKLLEKYYLNVDEKNMEVSRQKKAVELVEGLKKGNIKHNGDEYVSSLIALKAEGLAEDIHAAISDEFIKQLIVLAKEDVAVNRLSTPTENNALSKYNNALKLDESNAEALQGLVDIANKYIDLATSLAGKGKTAQVQEYIKKASSIHPNVISGKEKEDLIVNSTNVEVAIQNRGQKEEDRAVAEQNHEGLFIETEQQAKQTSGEKSLSLTRLAFVLTKDDGDGGKYYIFQVSDSDGRNPRTILQSKQPIISPSWSPDGERLCYIAFKNGIAEVFVQDLHSGQRNSVASLNGQGDSTAWSPDGEKIALTISKSGKSDIYVLELATGELSQITHNSHSIDTEAVWMANNRELAFTSDRGGRPQIYKVSVDGGRATRLTFEGTYNSSPDISPDGRILTMVHGFRGKFFIAVQDLETGTVQVLTETGRDESPSFAPNGRTILYATKQKDKAGLAVVAIDGRTQKKLELEAVGTFVMYPAWSPFRK